MKKLILISLSVVLLGLGGCSSTDDIASAESKESKESNKKSVSKSRRSGDCGATTGTRLGNRCR